MTQIGDCADCIISVPQQPKTSMRYEIGITQGLNLVQKRVGAAIGYYHSNGFGTEGASLIPGQSITWSTGFTSFCISTDQPVQVSTTTGTLISTFNVSQLLFMDQPYDEIVISNPSSATVVANVALYFTSPDPA